MKKLLSIALGLGLTAGLAQATTVEKPIGADPRTWSPTKATPAAPGQDGSGQRQTMPGQGGSGTQKIDGKYKTESWHSPINYPGCSIGNHCDKSHAN